MKKRFISLFLTMCIVFNLISTIVIAADNTLYAVPSKTDFVMDEKPISVTQAYNVNGNNYLQLRAIAELLNGTAAQFNIYWDGTYAVIETGKPYTGKATPTTLRTTTNVRKSSTIFKLEGKFKKFVNAYLIDGDTNYLQLREFASEMKGTASQFNVYWDAQANQAVIVPGAEYTGQAPADPAPAPKPSIFYTDPNVTGINNGYQMFDAEGNISTKYLSDHELVITQNIETIEDYTFYGIHIRKFTVDENNPNFTSVDGVLFNKDKTKLIAYPINKTDKTYTIPDSVTEIVSGAFAFSVNLEEVKFGSKLRVIGRDAFRGCHFTEVEIPENVNYIYGCAFDSTKELKKITIPPSVYWIANDILSGSNPDIVIYGENGSQAESLASQYGYKFVGTDPADPLGLTTIKLGQTELEAGIGKDCLVHCKAPNGIWGIYGSYDYKKFLAVYYENSKARFIYTTDLSTYIGDGVVYTDKNDNNRQYAASIGTLPSFDDKSNEDLIFYLTNAFRAVHGLSPFRWNEKLEAAARSHSKDMEIRNFFSHTNPDGLEPQDRVTAAGYKWSACGENIYMSSSGVNAILAVDAWINSLGHRQNLLTTACDQIGIGVSGAYATQNFGKQ